MGGGGERLVIDAQLTGELADDLREATEELREVRRETERLNRASRSTATGGLGRMDGMLGRARRGLLGVHRAATSLSRELGGAMARGLRVTALGLGAAAAAATGFGLKTAAGFETSKIQLEGLVGSVAGAERLFDRLVELDPKVPFDLAQLQQTTAGLLNFGFTADTVLTTLTGIADLAASTADPAQALSRVARAVGQINASGFVRAEELNQLIDAGVAVAPAMEEAFGKSFGEIRRMMERGADLPAGDFIEVLLGSRAGVAERVATETLTGLLSSVRSRVQRELAAEASPLVEAIKSALPRIEEGVGVLLQQVAPPLLQVGGILLDLLVKGLPMLAPVLGAVASGVGTLLGAAEPALAALAPVMDDLALAVGEFVTELVPVMPDLVGLFVAIVDVLPDFVRLLADLIPLAAPLASLVTDLLGFGPVKDIMAGLLFVLLGYRALSAVAVAVTAMSTALTGMATAQWGLNAAQAASPGTPGTPGVPRVGGPPGGGGLMGGLKTLGKSLGFGLIGGAIGHGVGWLGGQAVGRLGGLSGDELDRYVRAASTAGRDIGFGAGSGAVFGPGGMLVGGLAGGAVGYSEASAQLQGPRSAPLPPSMTPTSTVSTTTVQPGGIVVYPQTEMELQRAIPAGIEQYERDRAERGG